MTNHPNRSHRRYPSPSPAEVKAARSAAGQTIWLAAETVMVTTNAWERWESEGESSRAMLPGLFELYLIKTGQREVA